MITEKTKIQSSHLTERLKDPFNSLDSSNGSNRKRRVDLQKCWVMETKRDVFSQDDFSLSLSASLGRRPCPKAIFVDNETGNKPEELIGGNIHSGEIMVKLTEEFKSNEIYDSKINLKLANAVNKVWDKNTNF